MRRNSTALRYPCAVFADRTAVENGGNRPQCGVKIDRTADKIDRTAAEIDRSAAPHCALSGRTASRSARNAPRTMKATALLSTMSLPSILG